MLSPEDLAASALSCSRLNAIAENALYAQNRDLHGSSAVHWAAERGEIATLDKALRHGLDINNATRSLTPGRSPVLTAADYGQHLAVAWFLRHDVNITQIFPRYVHQHTEDRYTVDEEEDPISGSNAIIRKVRCHQSGETFARKSFQKIYSPTERRDILKEIAILKVCRHENLTRFVDAYEETRRGQRVHIVIAPWAEYTLEGFLHDPDDERCEQCPWFAIGSPESDRRIYRILMEIADAVSYLHDRGIKHKDIKPDNILLSLGQSGEIITILADFGISKVYKPGYPTDYDGGTYSYLAPEQWRKEGSSFSADVWQLGCCSAMLLAVVCGGSTALWELWESFSHGRSCCIAREHESFMDTLQAICSGEDARQRAVHRLVTCMLALEPGDRPVVRTIFAALKELVLDH